MALTPRPDHGANRRNLARLCLLRGVLVVALLLAAMLASLLQGLPLHRDGGLVLAVLGLTAFNFWTLWRLRRGVPVGELGLFLQLVADVLLMSLVFYRTGGATNPFVSWYLVPLTIAAATLRLRFAVGVALLALAAYTVLLSHYVPFGLFAAEPVLVLESAGPATPGEPAPVDPHAGHDTMTGEHAGHDGRPAVPSDAAAAPAGHAGFNLHIAGMWLNFVLSAGLITFFVSRMSHALRDQDHRLAEQREHLLQREQVVALGALAAGAAHELGTPLSTMSVIARDIEAELPADSPLREDAELLRSQLAQCRDILHNLRAQAAGEGIRQPLSRLLGHALERMQLMHPACRFELALDCADRVVQAPATLPQVLVNLVDNAAQASRERVSLRAADRAGELLLEIRDDGPGIAPEVAERLGEPFVSGRADGLGIGYFLSHASVNQWGGSIHLQPRPEGGTLTSLRLPWAVLRPAAPGEGG